jgi:hypothetical protein
MTTVIRLPGSASSQSTLSTSVRPLKPGVAAGGSARPDVGEA